MDWDMMLVGATLASVAAWFVQVARDDPRRRRTLAMGATASAIWWALWTHVTTPSTIPTRYIHFLQEGTTEDTIRAVDGVAAHVGGAFITSWIPLLAGLPATLRSTAWVGIGLLPLLVGLVVLLAREIADSVVVGVIAGLVLLLCPPVLHAASSGLPAMLGSIGLLLSAAIYLWAHDRTLSPTSRTLSVAAFALLTLAIGRLRFEWAAPGLGAAIFTLLARLPALRRLAESMRQHVNNVVRTYPLAVALNVGAVAILYQSSLRLQIYDRPLNLSAYGTLGKTIETLWITLSWESPHIPDGLFALASWMPIGAFAALVIGTIASLAHPVRGGGLGAILVVLMGVFHQVSHECVFEIERYASALLPLFALVAAGGWRVVNNLVGPRHPVLLLLSGLVLIPPRAQEWSTLAAPWPLDADRSWPRGTLNRAQQIEARMLLDAIELHPECVVAGYSRLWTGEPPTLGALWPTLRVRIQYEPAYSLVVARIPESLRAYEASTPTGILAHARCVLWIDGRACADANVPCADRPQQLERIAVSSEPLLAYVHSTHLAPDLTGHEIAIYLQSNGNLESKPNPESAR